MDSGDSAPLSSPVAPIQYFAQGDPQAEEEEEQPDLLLPATEASRTIERWRARSGSTGSSQASPTPPAEALTPDEETEELEPTDAPLLPNPMPQPSAAASSNPTRSSSDTSDRVYVELTWQPHRDYHARRDSQTSIITRLRAHFAIERQLLQHNSAVSRPTYSRGKVPEEHKAV